MNVRESLTARVGPLPAWAWGLGLGGVIVAVRAYRAAHVSSSVPAPTGTSDGATVDAGTNTSPAGAGTAPSSVGAYPIPSAYQNFGGVIGSDGTSNAGADSGPTNNQDWSNKAFDVLHGLGYQPLAATEAIRKYLNGDPVTTAEEQMISAALAHLGPPPEGSPALTRATGTDTGSTVDQGAPSAATPLPYFYPVAPLPPVPWAGDVNGYPTPGAAPTTPPEPTPAPSPTPTSSSPTPAPDIPRVPAPATPTAATRPTLTIGSQGPAVRAAAQWFNVTQGRSGLPSAGGNWLLSESTSTYDQQFAQGVSDFQRFLSNGTWKGPYGVIDADTWALMDYIAKQRNTPIPAF